ncbi:homogentisate 1,2-dioxygenase [Coniella lustricola]|uniref:homogentisate 1,2-dioxygenase n=1 Tax=Coniella lustricola TaxID=2025994 RepID=A0A2T3A7S1_9PEZI|nr:homogentisate 1,2-dioxygenase [Coniella lustricola]
MDPQTRFAVGEKYAYSDGLGNYLQSEALPGALPAVINSPQKPPFGLRTERISGSAFVAPRHHSYHTFLYRVHSSMDHSEFMPLNITGGYGSISKADLANVSPNTHFWNAFPVPESADWVSGQQLLGRTGDPHKKEGASIWIFAVTDSMPEHQAFASLDGEMLIVPQSGALDIQTELGRLLVRQNEIAVIPRGVRHRVTLVDGAPCRGYICELHQGHFRLPELGVIGTVGLAGVRDFQVPKACIDAAARERIESCSAARIKVEWDMVARLSGKYWHCTQHQTPFDVAAWHGQCYPYKYDLSRFAALGAVRFDHHDPSLFTVLTARNHGAEPSTAVLDFALIPPRWAAMKDTLWIPYYHRNTMQEFFGAIVQAQDPQHPLNGKTAAFRPFGGGCMNAMSTHGAAEADLEREMARDTEQAAKVAGEGVAVFVFELDRPVVWSDWALDHVELNHWSKLKL